MGLDMYLCGVAPRPDGMDVIAEVHELEDEDYEEIGYWRKHPNLHGFFVKEFANGVDECQRIYLTLSDIEKTIEAVKNNDLPETSGSFFGQSSSAEDQDTLDKLNEAKLRLESIPGYKVFYQASW